MKLELTIGIEAAKFPLHLRDEVGIIGQRLIYGQQSQVRPLEGLFRTERQGFSIKSMLRKYDQCCNGKRFFVGQFGKRFKNDSLSDSVTFW